MGRRCNQCPAKGNLLEYGLSCVLMALPSGVSDIYFDNDEWFGGNTRFLSCSDADYGNFAAYLEILLCDMPF